MSPVVLLLSFLIGPLAAVGPSDPCTTATAQAAAHAADKAWAVVITAAQPIYASHAGCSTAEHGSLAYYLGAALQGVDRPDAALDVWRDGYLALRAQQRFDARLADAYLHLLLATEAERFEAESTTVFEDLLGAIGPATPRWNRPVLRQLVMDMLPLFTEAEQPRLISARTPERVRWEAETSAFLQTWWRRQDPKPFTVHNERIAEHLRRVHHVRAAYAVPTSSTGYDARGALYLRLGEPDKVRTIRFADLDFMRDVVRFGVNVQATDFPRNEIWLYPHVDWSGVFIFINEGGTFRLGTATDLLAPRLRTGFNASAQSQNRALSTVAALRYIYSELAMYHSTFGNLSADLDALYQLQSLMREAIEEKAKGGISSTVDVQAAGPERGVASLASTPSSAAARVVTQSEQVEAQLAIQRAERVPVQYTATLRDIVPLPVAVRTARFLDPDGTTRTEVYWHVEADALRPTEGQTAQLAAQGLPRSHYLLRASAAQQTNDFRTRQVVVHHASVREGEPVPVQTLTTRGDRGRYHLGLQWDQFLVRPAAPDEPVSQLRLTTGRRDALDALPSDPARLTMSDLKPLRVADIDTFEPTAATPYPNAVLTPETALALYFEVYHLTLAEGDEAEFAVEYDVRRTGDDRGLLRWLGRPDTEASSTRVVYRTDGRTAREYILLDLSSWRGTGTLDVTLRVTDRYSGQQVSRSMTFQLAQSS